MGPETLAPEYVSRAQVSKMLGVSPNTVTRWAREGRLPCQITLGGHHRFDREVIERLSLERRLLNEQRRSLDRRRDQTRLLARTAVATG